MEDTQSVDVAALEARLASVEAQLSANQAALHELLAHARGQQDFVDEMRPIAMSVARVGTEKLGALEAQGGFAFARSALRVLERVATSYSAEDVDALGDSVVAILDTVRALTQPEILALVQEGAETLEEAEKAEPIGVIGLARASGDVNVQKGLGVLVAGLRHVGRASRVLSKRARALRQPGEATASHRPVAPPPTPRPAAPRASAPHAAPHATQSFTPVQPFAAIQGLVFDAEGFLTDHGAWSREAAEAIAADLDILLGERHWIAILTARRIYEESGKSPNIRKLTSSCEVCTKELYQLFPTSPGKTVARIAGIPKPVGCL
ncbi:MAG: TusE/DsrC/DsvC family sulfur relay protein [Alphaproteobacteria bacterium]|nr:TusE/DsrC/DsvC family sulfur relay protein [Alphaproteobacteria bacterium]